MMVPCGPDEIARLIPHRPPFLLVDRIERFTSAPVPSIRTSRRLSANEWIFAGHFPGLAVLPGALILEGLAQTMALLRALRGAPPREARELGMLASSNLKFLAPVFPGVELFYEVRLVREIGALALCEAEAEVEGKLVAKGTLSVARVEAPFVVEQEDGKTGR